MHNAQTIFGTLHVEARENNSANGNPRFTVSIHPENGSSEVLALTKPDSSLAYGIDNIDNRKVPKEWKVGTYRGRLHVEEV